MTSVKDLLFCVSVESRHSSQYMQSKLFEMLDIKKDLLKVDSQCKYGLVAHGIASAYLRWPISNTYEEKIWVLNRTTLIL